MPVTLEAALNDPSRSGRSAYRSSSARSWAWSMWPSRSSRIVTTSAIDSRQGSSLLWCSYGPMKTTGRWSRGMRERRSQRSSRSAGIRSLRTSTSRLIAAVEPEPQKMTACRSVRPDRAPDEASRLLAEAGGLEPGPGRLRVGVRVQRQDRLADVVLDEREASTGRCVVRVGHAADAVRARDGLVIADDGGADQVDQGVGFHRPQSMSGATLARVIERRRRAGYGIRTGVKSS